MITQEYTCNIHPSRIFICFGSAVTETLLALKTNNELAKVNTQNDRN